MPDDILTPQEAADLLGCNEKTLRNARRDGRIQGINVGTEKKPRWLFRRADVEAFELAHEGREGAGRPGALPGALPKEEKRHRLNGVSVAPDVWRAILEARESDEPPGRALDRIVRQWQKRRAALAALDGEEER